MREPVGLYLYRLVVGAAILGFLTLTHYKVQRQQRLLADIRQELHLLREALQDWSSPLQGIEVRQPAGHEGAPPALPLADRAYPDLLEADPFYNELLPLRLLPHGFKPRHSYRSDILGQPENIHPFSGWANVRQWRDLCTVNVAKNQFGYHETLAPDMAVRMEERLNPATGLAEFWVFLRDGVYWQPLEQRFFGPSFELAPWFTQKHKVTAHDFKFYFDCVMNPSMQESDAVALRTYLGDIDDIEVKDDLTFVVRWQGHEVRQADGTLRPMIKYAARQLTGTLQPLPSFVYKYFADGSKILDDDGDPAAYRSSSVFAQNLTHHWANNIIVSCGPWLFDGMDDAAIRLRRNADHYEPLAALAQRSVVRFRPSPEALWLAFKAKESDFYVIAPDKLPEWQAFQAGEDYHEQRLQHGMEIDALEFLYDRFSYIGWNNASPLFNSALVRQALTMALDRRRIIDQYLNGMGVVIHGPFRPSSPNNDPALTPWPYDPQEAIRLLEEEGWYDNDGDGVREKLIDGKTVPFEFSMIYYVKNLQSSAIVEYAATALREVGVLCRPLGLDLADLTREFEDKSFDALQMAWVYGAPPDDPRQLWHSQGAKEKGSSNSIGFANATADAIIDRLRYAYDSEERLSLYRRFDALLHQEQPYTFLYCPKALLLHRSYLKNVFVPAQRHDLLPGADVDQPQPQIYWIDKEPLATDAAVADAVL